MQFRQHPCHDVNYMAAFISMQQLLKLNLFFPFQPSTSVAMARVLHACNNMCVRVMVFYRGWGLWFVSLVVYFVCGLFVWFAFFLFFCFWSLLMVYFAMRMCDFWKGQPEIGFFNLLCLVCFVQICNAEVN